MKILYITTVAGTMNFFCSFIEKLIQSGNHVDIVTNDIDSKLPVCYKEWGCGVHTIRFSRSPLKKRNILAIKELRKKLLEGEYDIVHCHTPVAAMCTRIAAKEVRKKGTKVFYTAHGFHFFKGAPVINWLIYFPVEWLCAWWTDVLITINTEDYEFAKKHLHAKKIQYVPGVGIDEKKIKEHATDREKKRIDLGIPNEALLLLSIGELNQNKNHELVIRAIKDIDVYYIVAGNGKRKEELEMLAKELYISDRVKLLGHRNDVIDLCKSSDLFVFPSFREGLPVSVMEAMACSLPVVCSEIRGNMDLIDDKGGCYFKPDDVVSCHDAIEYIFNSDIEWMGRYNAEKVKKYGKENINEEMMRIYCS